MLNVKVHILFYGDNSRNIPLRQMKFSTVKEDGHTYKFYLLYMTKVLNVMMVRYIELCWDRY
jgi:hypothetical protein